MFLFHGLSILAKVRNDDASASEEYSAFSRDDI